MPPYKDTLKLMKKKKNDDKEEAGIGCDGTGHWGENWGSFGRQRVPGELRVSRCRAAEDDLPIRDS